MDYPYMETQNPVEANIPADDEFTAANYLRKSVDNKMYNILDTLNVPYKRGE